MAETIAVDIDDVLVKSASAIAEHLLAEYGTRIDLKNIYSRHPATYGAPDLETVARRVNNFLNSEELPPIEEAAHVLRKLYTVHRLLVVTGRPNFLELTTRDWLQLHFSDLFENVAFTNYFDSTRHKGEVCNELGVTVLIDDHMAHCLSALEHGVRPILFGDYPWNQANDLPSPIHRAHNWQEIEALLL